MPEEVNLECRRRIAGVRSDGKESFKKLQKVSSSHKTENGVDTEYRMHEMSILLPVLSLLT